MQSIKPSQTDIDPLLQRVRDGDPAALDELLAKHRSWIRGVVDLRLDPRLRRRVDPSDVVQEVQMEVARRIGDFLAREPMPFQLWLRQTAYDNLIDLRRKHLSAECRSVQREVCLGNDSSLMLIRALMGQDAAPDQGLLEQELKQRMESALDQLPDDDREIVVLRVLEGLENQEVSQVLGIHPSTGSKRFGRALFRLRALLTNQDSSS